MIKKYLLITWIMLKNSYIRDSKIPGYVASKIASQFLEVFLYIVLFKIIFNNIQSLAGWNYYQVLFLYFFSRSIMLLDNLLFKKSIATFTKSTIRKGDYDFYLVKPISPMYLVSIAYPQFHVSITAIFYIGASIYSLIHSNIEIHLINIIWFIFLAICGLILYYFLNIITVVPTFWFVRLYNLKDIIYKINHFMRYPIGIFPFALKIAFMVFFPIAAVSYIPAVTVFYPPKMLYIIFMVLITITFGLLANIFWKFGERHYSSASS